MSSSSLRTDRAQLIALAVLTSLVVMCTGALCWSTVNDLESHTTTVNREIATRGEAVGRLLTAFGYGHAIHNFKNHVLRRNGPYGVRFVDDAEIFHDAIAAYRSVRPTAQEAAALQEIEQVFERYETALVQIDELQARGSGALEIDAAVKIDDRPALSALQDLQRRLVQRRQEASGRTTDHLRYLRLVVSGSIGLLSILSLTLAMLVARSGLRESAKD